MIDITRRNWLYQGNIEEDLDGVIGARAKLALTAVGELLQKRIKARLNRPGNGVYYPSKKQDGSYHKASAPGEPPAPDTGGYRDAMQVDVVVFKYQYRLWFRNKFWDIFGRRLELGGHGGGAYIAPRPHIRPIFDRTLGEIQDILDGM